MLSGGYSEDEEDERVVVMDSQSIESNSAYAFVSYVLRVFVELISIQVQGSFIFTREDSSYRNHSHSPTSFTSSSPLRAHYINRPLHDLLYGQLASGGHMFVSAHAPVLHHYYNPATPPCTLLWTPRAPATAQRIVKLNQVSTAW